MHILTPILALLTTPTLLLAAPSTDLEHRSVAVVANFAPTSRFTRVPLNTRITLPVSSTTLTVKTLNNDFAVSAFRQAQNLKIDPAGPPPRDFKSDNGRWIDFDANSRFAVWAAAQNARKDKKFVSGTSGLNIVAWSTGTCSGGGRYYYNIGYNVNYYDPTFYDYSIQVSGRMINPAYERLWLKRWKSGSNYCGTDLNHYVYGNPGCAQNLPPFSCFTLKLK